MSLVVDNIQQGYSRISKIHSLASREKDLIRWFEHPASEILHHDSECCEEARLWFLSFARSMEIGSLARFNVRAPTWLAEHFEWGPTKWPISWCEVVEDEVIDCGVFAALAREIFKAQGHKAHPAQALLSYNEDCTKHWKNLWQETMKEADKKNGDVFPWIGDRLVYHELCVLETPQGEARFYDATHGTWYEPYQRHGFAALLAVKTECPRALRWGDKTLVYGEWVSL